MPLLLAAAAMQYFYKQADQARVPMVEAHVRACVGLAAHTAGHAAGPAAHAASAAAHARSLPPPSRTQLLKVAGALLLFATLVWSALCRIGLGSRSAFSPRSTVQWIGLLAAILAAFTEGCARSLRRALRHCPDARRPILPPLLLAPQREDAAHAARAEVR